MKKKPNRGAAQIVHCCQQIEMNGAKLSRTIQSNAPGSLKLLASTYLLGAGYANVARAAIESGGTPESFELLKHTFKQLEQFHNAILDGSVSLSAKPADQ